MDSELRPVMPFDLFMAAREGNNDVLIPRLGLQPDDEEVQTVQSELQSATGFGDTVLHLLVTELHNELALMVFQRDKSLLNARNKLSETPLHCAAKVGNEELIFAFGSDPDIMKDAIMKDAIKEKDEHGDTPLHVATKCGHMSIVWELMSWDPKITHMVNNEKLLPLHIAIMNKHTQMVIQMLRVDPTLACIPFSDGMFPVHVSARMGNIELVARFIEEYPMFANYLDPRRRNFFHIAAENNQTNIFMDVFQHTGKVRMVAQMNNATDNEGNTPLHIAAMKGHKSIMKAIWENQRFGRYAEEIRNNEGLTPFELSQRQQLEINKKYIDDGDIEINQFEGSMFTQKWFDDVMKPPPTVNKWEKTQVLGLGSVLITTVAFAAAFTIPGGYNQDKGTPVLGKKYMFRAFIVANTLAFIQGFVSLLVLLWETQAKFGARLHFATTCFLLAASCMVVAFGLGMYVTLAPICFPVAVLVLVVTLFIGSPVGMLYSAFFGPKFMISIISRLKSKQRREYFVIVLLTILFPLIFCLALL